MRISVKLILAFIIISTGMLFSSCTDNSMEGKADAGEENQIVDEHAGHNHVPGEHAGGSTAQTAGTEMDWCAEHAVPESVCTKCNPSLIEDFKSTGDWCAGHDLPESHCRLCNPGISFPQESMLKVEEAEVELDWCAEHAVPESVCTKCNPSLIEDFKSTGDWCAGHDLPESHCRLCNPGITFPEEALLKTETAESLDDQMEITLNFRDNAQSCATNGALIQFANSSTTERAGLSVLQVSSTTRNDSFDAPAEIVFDESETNVITSTVPALVSRWIRSPGENVKKGDVLAMLQSPEIAELEANLLKLQASLKVQQKELDRHKELLAKELISTSDYDQQEALTEQVLAEFTSAKRLLLSAGLNDEDIQSLIDTKTVSSNFVLRSQSDGMLVERIAQLGKLHDAGSAFAILANPQAMWVEAQLTEQQIRFVENGQKMKYTSDGRGINQVGAEIIWVSRFLDPHTRTGTVRARVMDPSAKLQAGEFGVVSISKSYDELTLLVPKDAVQWEGCCNVVFVKESDSRYRPHKVNLIGRMGEYYQVSDGVSIGDQVVVNGSFLLKTELMKSSIGAGCCGLEPVG